MGEVREAGAVVVGLAVLRVLADVVALLSEIAGKTGITVGSVFVDIADALEAMLSALGVPSERATTPLTLFLEIPLFVLLRVFGGMTATDCVVKSYERSSMEMIMGPSIC